jgi:signal transduction histidine kinase
MRQAGCNMTNTESYIRSTIALLVALVALKFDLWYLWIVSAILFYTAYRKYCLMFSLLGINKKLSVENYFQALLSKYSPTASCIFDKNGDVVYMNDVALDEFDKIENASDLGIVDASSYILSDSVSSILLQYKEQTYQLQLRGIQKENVLLLHMNNITKVLELEYANFSLKVKVKDVLSENEIKDHLLIQKSKLATTGELIENIIHQWKQPLNALSALLGSIQLTHTLRPMSTEEMDTQMLRATKLIKIMSTTMDDFRNFFKKDKQKSSFKISECMGDVMLILGDLITEENIEVLDKIDPDVTVEGFKNEFSQVLLNIILNAKDAFLEKQCETRRIELETSVEDEKILLRITDTAGGIADKDLGKIFDSHFTTKEKHEGTGIGLHMSKLIIENDMNGTIVAENYQDGARFVLTFPKPKNQMS